MNSLSPPIWLVQLGSSTLSTQLPIQQSPQHPQSSAPPPHSRNPLEHQPACPAALCTAVCCIQKAASCPRNGVILRASTVHKFRDEERKLRLSRTGPFLTPARSIKNTRTFSTLTDGTPLVIVLEPEPFQYRLVVGLWDTSPHQSRRLPSRSSSGGSNQN